MNAWAVFRGTPIKEGPPLPSSSEPAPWRQGGEDPEWHASPLQVGCAIIAGFLHYLFLACFFWMLIEAMMLFLMVRNLKVVNYFSSRNIKMLYLCAFAYGVPGLVVLISASVQPQGYGTHNL